MIPNHLHDIIVSLLHRTEEIERRLENQTRTGLVTEVDPVKGLARVQIDKDPKTGEPVKTGWIPWKEPGMGKIKFHIPPSVGEQVKITSESGDLTDGIIDYSLTSDANPRPHGKDGEMKIQIGETYLLFTDGKIEMNAAHIHNKAGRIDHDQNSGGGASGVPVA